MFFVKVAALPRSDEFLGTKTLLALVFDVHVVKLTPCDKTPAPAHT
jgi:hypothetical protein